MKTRARAKCGKNIVGSENCLGKKRVGERAEIYCDGEYDVKTPFARTNTTSLKRTLLLILLVEGNESIKGKRQPSSKNSFVKHPEGILKGCVAIEVALYIGEP